VCPTEQYEVLGQSRKQCDRRFFHEDEDFGLVLLQFPVEIPGDSLLYGHLQNTPYMVVFEIIYSILFVLSTLYDGFCQYIPVPATNRHAAFFAHVADSER
jgi:hypothetical protein